MLIMKHLVPSDVIPSFDDFCTNTTTTKIFPISIILTILLADGSFFWTITFLAKLFLYQRCLHHLLKKLMRHFYQKLRIILVYLEIHAVIITKKKEFRFSI